MQRFRYFAVLVAVASSLAWSQDQNETADPEETVTAPPLVDGTDGQVSDVPPTPPPEVAPSNENVNWPPPGDKNGALRLPPQVANVPANTNEVNAPNAVDETAAAASHESRMKRVGLSLLLGAGAGSLGALIGFGFTATSRQAIFPLLPNGWLGAAVGFAIAAPIGVLVADWLCDGTGKWWAAVLGDLVGTSLAAIVLAFSGSTESLPIAALAILGGTVIGYEASAPDGVQPVAMTPGKIVPLFAFSKSW